MSGELVLPVALIVRGTGKRVKKEELEFYEKLKKFVVVFWQKKAWIDRFIEKKVIEKLVLPYRKRIKADFAREGMEFPGLLLLEDRGPGHDDPDVLAMTRENQIDVVLTPAETTPYIQLVDDGRGKALRNFVYEKFDSWLEGLEVGSEKLSVAEKRMKTVQFVKEAVESFASSMQETVNTIHAAIRTGGRMQIVGDLEELKPNRFPADFGASILPRHPLSALAKPYAPLYSALAKPDGPALAAAAGAATVEPTEATVTGGSITITGVAAARVVATGGTIEIDGDRITARGGTVAVSLAPPATPPETTAYEVGYFDGHSSDEEEQIFLRRTTIRRGRYRRQ